MTFFRSSRQKLKACLAGKRKKSNSAEPLEVQDFGSCGSIGDYGPEALINTVLVQRYSSIQFINQYSLIQRY